MTSHKKHWRRDHDLENTEPKVAYAWRNKHNERPVQIWETGREKEGNNVYELEIDGVPEETEYTNKEKAKKNAIQIMEQKTFSEEKLSGEKLHETLVSTGKEVEPSSQGVANDLNEDQIKTFLATLQAFGSREQVIAQAHHDLTQYKYRVFDHMGMMLDGDALNERENWLYEKMANIYIEEKDVNGFIRRLRTDDLLLEYRSQQ